MKGSGTIIMIRDLHEIQGNDVHQNFCPRNTLAYITKDARQKLDEHQLKGYPVIKHY